MDEETKKAGLPCTACHYCTSHCPQQIKISEIMKSFSEMLAMRFIKGRHAFIVATHIDKAHIHNHIIFNSTSLDCTKKFRDFHLSGLAVSPEDAFRQWDG